MKTKLILFYTSNKQHLTEMYLFFFEEGKSTVRYYEFLSEDYVEITLTQYDFWMADYGEYMEIIE